MQSARRVLTRSLFSAVLIVLFAAAQAEAHEVPHQRPKAKGSIDPRQSYLSLVVSGAGGHFHTLLLFPDTRTLLAGTHLGLFRSDDRGLTWRLAAARFSGEEIHGVARDPRTGILYTVTHGQGFLRSEDGGRRWQPHTRGLPDRDLHALALDPRRPQILYVWVVGHGLFRSEDGGKSWSSVAGAAALPDLESLVVHPEEPDRLYAGTAGGVWVSDDGGRRWRFPAGGLRHRTAGVSVPPWRSDLLFAATLEGAFMGKTDGTEWRPFPPHPSWWGPITAFAFLRERPEVVFAVTHEGVIAARKLTGNEWLPLADLSNPDRDLRQE